MPKISIVTPVYGVEKFIDRFISSVNQQSLSDFEVIFIDDGSPDNCPSILDEYSKKDERCVVIHQKNKGAAAARNAGILKASGEYIYFADSDDWLDGSALSSLWKEAERTHADVIYGMVYIEVEKTGTSILKGAFSNHFHTEDPSTINQIQRALIDYNEIPTNCAEFKTIKGLGGALWRGMIKRKIIQENTIFFNEKLFSLGEDILFLQEVYEHVNSVSYIETPIYHYSKRGDSLSHGFKKNQPEIYRAIFEEEERFLTKNNKSKEHWEGYYYRVIFYIRHSLGCFYKNRKNKSPFIKRYNEFVKMLDTEPYKTAIQTVPIKRQKISLGILLLKLKFYLLYWFLSRK